MMQWSFQFVPYSAASLASQQFKLHNTNVGERLTKPRVSWSSIIRNNSEIIHVVLSFRQCSQQGIWNPSLSWVLWRVLCTYLTWNTTQSKPCAIIPFKCREHDVKNTYLHIAGHPLTSHHEQPRQRSPIPSVSSAQEGLQQVYCRIWQRCARWIKYKTRAGAPEIGRMIALRAFCSSTTTSLTPVRDGGTDQSAVLGLKQYAS
jgi:hypothetical protein